MKQLTLLFFLLPVLGFSQTVDIEEQSASACYSTDNNRPQFIAISKLEVELDNLHVEGYFDCNYPMAEPCSDDSLKKYQPNSLLINGSEKVILGEQLNGDHISRYNIGRFFTGIGEGRKYITLEMANIHCPNVTSRYVYIIVAFNENNKLDNHILYTKEHNPMMEEELSRIISSIYKTKKVKKE